ncbi:MAG: IPT/TIG domain-containing protein, partial [Verrucomicrobia bacterium]|nr:IPT/TIG domain-containing protein [Verrucomicrobiota bacterium]
MPSAVAQTGRLLVLCVGLLFGIPNTFAQGPPRLGLPLLLTNPAIQITVIGQAGKYHRVDVSTNLSRWGPLEIVRTTNGTATLIDPGFQTLPLRFYRASQVEPATELQRLSVNVGPPGTQVAIQGQFFASGKPGDNVVTLGGTQLKVVEATPTRLLVEIPAGASSGALLVTTPNGTSLKTKPFTVTGPAPVQLEPPPGMQATDFSVVNTYGWARPASLQSTQQVVTVRRGRPLFTVAAPKDTNRQTFFYAVSLTDVQPITLGAASTAEALVFLSPRLLTSDPFLAEQTLVAIQQDTNVQQLARVITQLYAQDPRPLENTNLLKAYADAVISVSKAARQPAAVQPLGKRSPPSAAGSERRAALNNLDLEYVAIEGSGRARKAEAGSGSVPPWTNPVDWLVVFQEVDAERAFPQGRFDFDRAVNERRKLVNYPVRGDFRETRSVEAELLTGNLDIVETLINKLSDELQSAIWDEAIEFPDRDALYIARAIGPAFSLQDEFDFVTDHFPEERTRVWFINILHIVMDLVSAVSDLSGDDEEFIDELAQELEAEFARNVPQVRSKEDLGRLVIDLAAKASEKATRSVVDWAVDAALPWLK